MALQTDSMLQWFECDGLTPESASIGANFRSMAVFIVDRLPRNPERTVALRKLLEAKDAAIRSTLFVGGGSL